MNRRGFLGAILATGVAPAFVRAESLMRIVVPSREIWTPYAMRGMEPVQVYANIVQADQEEVLDIEAIWESIPPLRIPPNFFAMVRAT